MIFCLTQNFGESLNGIGEKCPKKYNLNYFYNLRCQKYPQRFVPILRRNGSTQTKTYFVTFVNIWLLLQLTANGEVGHGQVLAQKAVAVDAVQKLERRLSLKPTEEHVLDLQPTPRLATHSNVPVCAIFHV